ncbi:PIN/TRAM domain-containing protein [Tissierella sp.]|uniref:PIN/TRAM domain-containing protein n=1 Tax=Tissierella sp. TaxID=41274 RepID=UPI0028B0B964|nr:PIN/TRAM domain-containing protein [Tissierella sp.]
MIDKILKGVIGLIGALMGYSILTLFINLEIIQMSRGGWLNLIVHLGTSILFGIIFFTLSSRIIERGRRLVKLIENELEKFSVYDITISSVGLIVGLLIAFLLSQPLNSSGIPYVGVIASIMLYSIFGYLGLTIPHRKRDDISSTLGNIRRSPKDRMKSQNRSCPKILDTSVIIDGRIADICKTGFIEGPLIIPEFVLEELQHIADSSDSLKRNRGRRGLDILNKIQKELDIEVIINDKKFDDVQEVDSKLLKLTQLLKGKIITNDYNLNKVAEVQGIYVLNINELANAVKPVVLPGEEMLVQVVRDGKELNQGLAYLDDGTMIVVESGRKFIGETIDVVVTSVLQTSAGRMIFAKPKSMVDKAV